MDAITFETYLSKFPARSYKKRWPIINAGDELGKIFYLKKGFVRLFSISPEGKELTFIIYQPGEFFPLIAALLPLSPYRYFVETMTPSEIIAIPRSSFSAFFIKNPDLLLDLAVEIMKRLDRMLRRMEHLVFANAYQKVASIFAILAERFGEREGKSIVIRVPLAHRDIASLVGIARETASLEIKKLEKKGIISYRKRLFTINSVRRLERQAVLDRPVTR